MITFFRRQWLWCHRTSIYRWRMRASASARTPPSAPVPSIGAKIFSGAVVNRGDARTPAIARRSVRARNCARARTFDQCIQDRVSCGAAAFDRVFAEYHRSTGAIFTETRLGFREEKFSRCLDNCFPRPLYSPHTESDGSDYDAQQPALRQQLHAAAVA